MGWKAEPKVACDDCSMRLLRRSVQEHWVRRHLGPSAPAAKALFAFASRTDYALVSCDDCGELIARCTLLAHSLLRHGDERLLSPAALERLFRLRSAEAAKSLRKASRPSALCDDCGERLSRECLLRHLASHKISRRATRPVGPPFHCDLCPERALEAVHMARHWQRAHSKSCAPKAVEPRGVWDECGQLFVRSSLKRHCLAHLGRAPKKLRASRRHVCDDCRRVFICKKSLTRHCAKHL